jgi:hypothetical protein
MNAIIVQLCFKSNSKLGSIFIKKLCGLHLEGCKILKRKVLDKK